MLVDYRCKECDCIKEISYNLEEGPPKGILCEKGHKMKRVFGNLSVHIPEWLGDSDHGAIADHMKNAPTPLGKNRIHY